MVDTVKQMSVFWFQQVRVTRKKGKTMKSTAISKLKFNDVVVIDGIEWIVEDVFFTAEPATSAQGEYAKFSTPLHLSHIELFYGTYGKDEFRSLTLPATAGMRFDLIGKIAVDGSFEKVGA